MRLNINLDEKKVQLINKFKFISCTNKYEIGIKYYFNQSSTKYNIALQ